MGVCIVMVTIMIAVTVVYAFPLFIYPVRIAMNLMLFMDDLVIVAVNLVSVAPDVALLGIGTCRIAAA